MLAVQASYLVYRHESDIGVLIKLLARKQNDFFEHGNVSGNTINTSVLAYPSLFCYTI